MAGQQKNTEHWTPAWVALIATLASAALVVGVQSHLLPVKWWGFPVVALAGAAMTVVATAVQGGWLRTHAARTATWLAAGVWTTWAAKVGWTDGVWLALLSGTLVLAALLHAGRTPGVEQSTAVEPDGNDRRPQVIREWEALLRRLAKAPVRVTAVQPWDNPVDGQRVYVNLPSEGEVTEQKLVDVSKNIAVAKRLPPGCGVRVLDGEHQGQIVLDVMLRDCLTDAVTVVDDHSEASVYDTFQVMTTPDGQSLEVCLRQQSMVVGGAPESGKTTLLHRIILFLARCSDTLIWVVDTNGGGVATPWVRPWAMGQAGRPVVDWVADSDEEAAVLVAVATAIAKDRKTAPEAVRRKHRQDTTVLPVDDKLPAIVVLNDEGGEMRQAISLLGQIADQGISRLAQIGRAEAVRTIKSVLRGTADLLDKGMRVCAALRICLRVEEDGEYVHVLGSEPGKTKLLHKGTGFIRRPGDPRPILGRTVNVLLSQIERAAVACSDLRPDLDDRGQRVAAKLRVRDVLGGRDPDAYPEIVELAVMQDVQAGRAYSGRWDRFAPRLAAMRGEDLPDVDDDDEPAEEPRPAPVQASRAAPGSALAALTAAVGAVPAPKPAAQTNKPAVDVNDQATVDREFERLSALLTEEKPEQGPVDGRPGSKMTAREHIVAVLTELYPEALMSKEIGAELEERGVTLNRSYRQELLGKMLQAGEIVQVDGRYTVQVKP